MLQYRTRMRLSAPAAALGLVLLGSGPLAKGQENDAAAPPALTWEIAEPTLVWGRDLEAARAEAQATGKPLIVEFTSKGCPWCKDLDEHVYNDLEVAAKMREQFVLVRPRGETARAIRKAFNVDGTPHAVILTPDESPALIYRLRGYRPPGSYHAALDAALRRWQEYASHPEVLTSLSTIDGLVDKDPTAACEQLEALIRQWPASGEAMRLRAYAHYSLRNLDAALADYHRAILMQPDNAWLYYGRGNVHYDMGRFEDAQRDFAEAVRRLGRYADYAVIRLWLAQARLGDGRAARVQVARYLNESGHDPRADWFRTWKLKYLAGGNVTEAAILGEGRKRRTKYRRISSHFLVAMQARAEGDRDKAMEHLEKAVALGPLMYEDYHSAVAELARLSAEPALAGASGEPSDHDGAAVAEAGKR